MSFPGRVLRACALLGALALPSCGTFIEYTDGLRSSPDYTPAVRGTAQVGGFLGGLVSIPVDVVALPVTFIAYLVMDANDPENVDFIETALAPTFFLRGVGSLLAVPVDLIEYGTYRAWLDDDTLTAEEQEELEMELDDETFDRYPVKPIYPKSSR